MRPPASSHGRRWPFAGSVLSMVAITAACSPTTGTKDAGPVLRVTERDFDISAPSTVSAGDVTLSVANDGPADHELIVMRADGSYLPLRADGVTVDEERLDRDKVGGLEPGTAGSVRPLALHLTPGRYVFFCNMSGHYLGGMRGVLEVT